MILLSFNITDSKYFLNNKLRISDEKLLEVLKKNTESILRTLELHELYATFFVQSELVQGFENLLQNIVKNGHEVALFHSGNISETTKAKQFIKDKFGKNVRGIRINGSFSSAEFQDLGISYLSPIEKMKITYLFRRFDQKTEIYTDDELVVIPETIAPYTQIPYNETVFQYVPMKYYENMVFETLKSSEYVLFYTNVLQFTDFEFHEIQIPFYKKYSTGKKMEDKLNRFLVWINDYDMATSTIKDYVI